jgi:hypothetical protein
VVSRLDRLAANHDSINMAIICPAKIVLTLPTPLVASLAEACGTRGLTVQSFITQLAEAAAADYRLQKITALPPPLKREISAADKVDHRCKMSDTKKHKFFHAYETEDLSPVQLARRFNISPQTARRYIAEHEAGQP